MPPRYDARRLITHVAAGEPRRAYFRSVMTWEEALAKDRQHGGEAWKAEGSMTTERGGLEDR